MRTVVARVDMNAVHVDRGEILRLSSALTNIAREIGEGKGQIAASVSRLSEFWSGSGAEAFLAKLVGDLATLQRGAAELERLGQCLQRLSAAAEEYLRCASEPQAQGALIQTADVGWELAPAARGPMRSSLGFQYGLDGSIFDLDRISVAPHRVGLALGSGPEGLALGAFAEIFWFKARLFGRGRPGNGQRLDVSLKGPGFGAFVGAKGGNLGGTVGWSAISVEGDLRLTSRVHAQAEIGLKLELGFVVGSSVEVKLPFFSLGLLFPGRKSRAR